MIWLVFEFLNAPTHHYYLLVPRISCRFQGRWSQTVGACPSADQTGSFTVQFKVTSNSLILSQAGCTSMHASANPPSSQSPPVCCPASAIIRNMCTLGQGSVFSHNGDNSYTQWDFRPSFLAVLWWTERGKTTTLCCGCTPGWIH